MASTSRTGNKTSSAATNEPLQIVSTNPLVLLRSAVFLTKGGVSIILKPSRLCCLLVISVVSLSTVGHQQQRSELAEAHVNRAKSLFAKGDLAGAIASYSDAIKVKPEWAEAYLKRGVALRMQGALDKAIEDFDKATALDPASTRNNRTIADAYGNHGQIQLSNLRPEDAIVDFEKALRIYPAGTLPYFDRGEARILIEDFTRAIEDFDTYLTKEKWDAFNKALAQANRSLAKHFLGRDDEAKGDLKSIVNLPSAEKKAVLQHMEELEVRLMIMRHIRSQRRKTIA